LLRDDLQSSHAFLVLIQGNPKFRDLKVRFRGEKLPKELWLQNAIRKLPRKRGLPIKHQDQQQQHQLQSDIHPQAATSADAPSNSDIRNNNLFDEAPYSQLNMSYDVKSSIGIDGMWNAGENELTHYHNVPLSYCDWDFAERLRETWDRWVREENREGRVFYNSTNMGGQKECAKEIMWDSPILLSEATAWWNWVDRSFQ
jgi:hypothetical protein